MDSPTQIENQTPKEKPVVISSEGGKKTSFKFSLVNPKILAMMTVLLLMVGGIGTGVYLIQQPQQATTQATSTPIDLVFQPSDIQTEAGSEFNTDIYVKSNNNQITSADLKIEYPVTLTLKTVTPGDFLPKVLIPPSISEGSATLSLGTEGTSGVTGNGVVATLTFKTSPGSSGTPADIKLSSSSKVNVLNRTPGSITDSFGSAKVTVAATQTTPSPSPSPLPSPVPSLTTSLNTSTSSASPSTVVSSTDFNDDGLTNSIDLSFMYSGWGNPQTDAQKKADLNTDGVINGIDYSIFLPKFRL